jgi:osmoprotectant transport system ATP-binding protein
MPTIQFDSVSKRYSPDGPPAVEEVSLRVADGSFVVILGPSGCGKTTLLKMVNRLIEPSGGTIRLDDTDVRALPVTELRRHIGYVIQQVGLFPHMTVAQNIAVVPDLLGWERARTAARTAELLAMMDLPADLARRYPAQLSGGQQQRVGIARALAADPGLMLMDEPFGAIDALTRTALQDQLLALQARLHKTVLFVTHDVDEALRLADQIIVMQAGRVVQYAEPCELISRPASPFVAGLLNSDDILRQFSLLRVGQVMQPLSGAPAGGPSLDAKDTLRAALSLLLQPGVERVTVTAAGQPVGTVTLGDLRNATCRGE